MITQESLENAISEGYNILINNNHDIEDLESSNSNKKNYTIRAINCYDSLLRLHAIMDLYEKEHRILNPELKKQKKEITNLENSLRALFIRNGKTAEIFAEQNKFQKNQEKLGRKTNKRDKQ